MVTFSLLRRRTSFVDLRVQCRPGESRWMRPVYTFPNVGRLHGIFCDNWRIMRVAPGHPVAVLLSRTFR
jgi:hypothetical protein